jgi:hypothetical protein
VSSSDRAAGEYQDSRTLTATTAPVTAAMAATVSTVRAADDDAKAAAPAAVAATAVATTVRARQPGRVAAGGVLVLRPESAAQSSAILADNDADSGRRANVHGH